MDTSIRKELSEKGKRIWELFKLAKKHERKARRYWNKFEEEYIKLEGERK